MVVDERDEKEKAKKQLKDLVDEATDGEYRLIPNVSYDTGDYDSEFYIVKTPKSWAEKDKIGKLDRAGLLLKSLTSTNINVEIYSPGTITFRTPPKYQELGMQIAMAYEAKFGQDKITMRSLKDT